MARRCSLTGKTPLVGNNVSHSQRKVKRVQKPNLKNKRIFVPELDRFVRVKISTRALRTINKKGFMTFLKDEGLSLKQVIS
jgi:large subunit ribosomal protein L28|tara:strand:+ start:252 stop:494 length:243 start_codon:yes stop_codon:yes gene_type:complete